jgi:hypothetical protein
MYLAANVDVHVVGQKVLCQSSHLPWPRGRPHEDLSVWSDLLDNLADLGLKSHIQHPVCLIQDQVGGPSQVSLAHLEKVNESSWSGNDYFAAIVQVPHLRSLGSSAKDTGVLDLGRAAKLNRHLLENLEIFWILKNSLQISATTFKFFFFFFN